MKKLFQFIFIKFISVLLCLKWRLKNKCKISFDCRINKGTVFEGYNRIHRNVILIDSNIGYGTYIGKNSNIINTSIGRYCSIAGDVKILFGNHPTKTIVSTHPAFYSTLYQSGFSYVDKNIFNEFSYAENNKYVKIGNDVWIGSNVKILNGVTIGDGAIIGACSFVTKNVEPYSIYSGVPAKKVRNRFTENQIDYLLQFKWWDKPVGWIKDNSDSFSDIEEFIQKFKE